MDIQIFEAPRRNQAKQPPARGPTSAPAPAAPSKPAAPPASDRKSKYAEQLNAQNQCTFDWYGDGTYGAPIVAAPAPAPAPEPVPAPPRTPARAINTPPVAYGSRRQATPAQPRSPAQAAAPAAAPAPAYAPAPAAPTFAPTSTLAQVIVDLSCQQLYTLPPELLRDAPALGAAGLAVLDLRSNNLDNQALESLASLFEAAAAAAATCPTYSMRVLVGGNRRLTALPHALTACPAVLEIDAAGCNLASAHITAPRLQRLDLSRNPALGTVDLACPSLRVLAARQCDLAQCPTGMFDCTMLETADLAGNRISILPPQILRCASLVALDLSYNSLRAVPPELCLLPRLAELRLASNPTRVVPAHALAAGDDVLLRELAGALPDPTMTYEVAIDALNRMERGEPSFTAPAPAPAPQVWSPSPVPYQPPQHAQQRYGSAGGGSSSISFETGAPYSPARAPAAAPPAAAAAAASAPLNRSGTFHFGENTHYSHRSLW